uniref:Serpin domain-containing protein n=1 Tax=Oryza punctata TaxID=4537 RepID=A0A0E0ME05_ORYPU
MDYVRSAATNVAGGQVVLAVRLAERLAAANPDHNLVFSPLTIHAALSLVTAGAGGGTLGELLGVLGAPSPSDLAAFASHMATTALADNSELDGPRVAFACGVWCDAARPLRPAYRDAVVGTYKAEDAAVDFKNKAEEARERMNEWTRMVTRGLIDSVLPPGSVRRPGDRRRARQRHLLQGQLGDRPFRERNTQRKPFYRLDGRTIHDVPYMSLDPFSHSPQFVAVSPSRCSSQLRYATGCAASWRRSRRGRAGSCTSTCRRERCRSESSACPSSRCAAPAASAASSNRWGSGFTGARQPVRHGGGGRRLRRHAVVRERRRPQGGDRGERGMNFVADHPFAYFVVDETSLAVVFAGQIVDPFCNDMKEVAN